MKPFYVTTPIYYVNDKPHIGHAYSTVAADVISRYQRLRGRPAFFLTGLDEHGLKIERRAQEEQLDPQTFVDRMAEPFVVAWQELNCQHDDFIRTTSVRHKSLAQKFWTKLVESGDVYLGDYEDWYCVGCESFKTEKELLPGNICAIHQKPVERIKEQSYFFRLSKYTDKLLAYYEAHPDFVKPEGRFNEVKSFVKEGLRDLSISRTSFRWGIPVPDHPEHVMYVWLDALTNYVSALGGPAAPGESLRFDKFWNKDATIVHVVGKDILRFHAIFWPAFLMSAGMPLPTQIWAHGWLTVDGQKMSKSLGNFVPPKPLIEAFGVDVLRYYFMREIGFGQDGDFSHKNLIQRYNGELGNGLGNLAQRLLSSILPNNLNGVIPPALIKPTQDIDRKLIEQADKTAHQAAAHMEELAFHRALDAMWELVIAANKYVDQSEPWKLAKEKNTERLGEVSYVILECLRQLSVMLWPIMPSKADELRGQLGLPPLMGTEDLDRWPNAWGMLQPGLKTSATAVLFPRIDDKREAELLRHLQPAAAAGAEISGKKVSPSISSNSKEMPMIEFDDFAKVDLRLGEVLSAEPVPKSDKLLKLQVNVGDEAPRQILAGIGQHYKAEELTGKKILVVCNLKPRKMMGLESHGMVLAASEGDLLSVLTPDRNVGAGSKAK